MMTAYLIVDLDIHNPEGFQEYQNNVSSFIAKHGGRYIVRGGEFDVIEGHFKPHRLVIFEFPNRRSIRNMFADEGYLKLAQVRFRTAKTIAVAVDGIEWDATTEVARNLDCDPNAAILALARGGASIRKIVRRTARSRSLVRNVLRGRRSGLSLGLLA
jgi:uncharacterized protein (DUF1330 family)